MRRDLNSAHRHSFPPILFFLKELGTGRAHRPRRESGGGTGRRTAQRARHRDAQAPDAVREVLCGGLEPAKNLPSLEALLARKGTYEAVLAGSARSRGCVDELASVAHSAGPALIVIDIVATIVTIEDAPPDERPPEVGGAVGSVVVGRYGGWVGAWASPTSAIPIVARSPRAPSPSSAPSDSSSGAGSAGPEGRREHGADRLGRRVRLLARLRRLVERLGKPGAEASFGAPSHATARALAQRRPRRHGARQAARSRRDGVVADDTAAAHRLCRPVPRYGLDLCHDPGVSGEARLDHH
jgi:hypothetical protein